MAPRNEILSSPAARHDSASFRYVASKSMPSVLNIPNSSDSRPVGRLSGSLGQRSGLHGPTGGKGKTRGGKDGVAQPRNKRMRKTLRDNILGITKPDIRRLARRGGVKRISADIYSSTREVMKQYLTKVLFDVAAVVDHSKRQTVTVTDVIWALRRQGRPIYGFDSDGARNIEKKKKPARRG
ncbi:histone-fold-containing protein [Calycina marina]|uniref:Histone H4 n=1 Tax=Calycina marina TaxID=1763456 RepID=A0A9P8CB04_9HELO|nr:histone-fold-containing protein [Calycina marina]